MRHPVLHSEVVRTLPRLNELEGVWWELFARTPRATPFQSPAWLLSWLEALGRDVELWTIAVFRERELVGLLPLFQTFDGPTRVGRFLGHGVSDYLDGLVDPTHCPDVVRTFWRVLDESPTGPQRLDLAALRADSPLLTEERPLHAERRTGEVCPKIVLDESFEAYSRRLPAWLRRNLEQGEARAERCGGLRWQLATGSTLPTWLAMFFDLHALRWSARGQRGALDAPAIRDFHQRATPRLLARGLLELSLTFVGDRPAAAALVLTRTDALLYLTGFDPALARFNPGTVAIGRCIARAIAESRPGFDFLRGGEAYKYAWCAEDSVTFGLHWETPVRHVHCAGARRA